MQLDSITVLGPTLLGGADAVARRSSSRCFDNLVPVPDVMPAGFQALAAVRVAWSRAVAGGESEAPALAASLRDAIVELRLTELRSDPLSTTLCELALERLAELGQPLSPDEL